jgi:hypothetical protein
MIDMESEVVAISDQVSADLQGEAVVLSLADATYYGLNDVGARIWELVQEPRRVGDVLDSLVAEFDVDASQCRSDLMAFLDDLQGWGLISVRQIDED